MQVCLEVKQLINTCKIFQVNSLASKHMLILGKLVCIPVSQVFTKPFAYWFFLQACTILYY